MPPRVSTQVLRAVLVDHGAGAQGPPPASDRMQAREGVSLLTRFTRGAPRGGTSPMASFEWQEAAREGRRLSKAAENGSGALARELRRVEADIRARTRPAGGGPMEELKASLGMHQKLAMTYLALQEQMQRGVTTLLSNLLKRRHDCVMNSMRQWH